MLNIPRLIIDPFVENLSTAYRRTYGLADPQFANIIEWAGHFALENIANCDAPYHDMTHTIMVTLAGQEIIRGKQLIEGGVKPSDWLHFIMALLCHDIGYVKGICRKDGNSRYATGKDGKTVRVDAGGTCAALTPYHVDRAILLVRERFLGNMVREVVNVERLVELIEITRFPPSEQQEEVDTRDFPGLVRAADFIGQLGDPDYIRKIPALFYEFEEIGLNAELGYGSPGDMRKQYAGFYWEVVLPHIRDALDYLRVTQEGKQWIANLYAHVFTIEHDHH